MAPGREAQPGSFSDIAHRKSLEEQLPNPVSIGWTVDYLSTKSVKSEEPSPHWFGALQNSAVRLEFGPTRVTKIPARELLHPVIHSLDASGQVESEFFGVHTFNLQTKRSRRKRKFEKDVAESNIL